MATKLFNIVSHFKFEVGSALTNTQKLQSSVQKLSGAAENVNNQFKGMFVSNVLAVTGGSGGILSMLKKAVDTSEAWYQSQRKITTLMVGNTKAFKKPITDWNEGMAISKKLMKELFQDANKYAINMADLVSTFGDINAMLVPKGAAGKDFQQTRKLTKNLLAGPDILGLEPWQVQNNIMGLLEGAVGPQGNVLFRRLVADTDAFSGMTPQKWNQMIGPRGKNMAKGVEKINKAFEQFFRHPKVLESMLKSLTGQFTILMNLTGQFSTVLKPLGDILRNRVVKALEFLNKWLQNQLAVTIKEMSPILEYLTRDFKGMFIQLEKLGKLSKDLDKSHGLATVGFFLYELVSFIPVLAGMKFIGAGLKKIGILIPTTFSGLIKWITKTTTLAAAFTAVFKFLGKAILRYMAWFIPIAAAVRVFTSASAQAKARDIEYFAKNMGKFGTTAKEGASFIFKLGSVVSFLTDKAGKSISQFMSYAWWVERIGFLVEKLSLNTALDKVIKGLVFVFDIFNLGIKAIGESLGALFAFILPGSAAFGNKNVFSQFMETISKHAGQVMKNQQAVNSWLAKTDLDSEKKAEDAAKARTVINIQKQIINNEFKENYEPDRVALAIKEVMLKGAQAPLSTVERMNSFSPGGN